MSDTGQPGGSRPADTKDKKGTSPSGRSPKRDKGGRSRKRGPLGSPLMWAAPVVLLALLAWMVLSAMGGFRAIDTSDGLAILKDSPETVKSVTVIDGTQRVELTLTESYTRKAKESGQTDQKLGKKVQFTFTDAQAEQVDKLVQDAKPSGGSCCPCSCCWALCGTSWGG